MSSRKRRKKTQAVTKPAKQAQESTALHPEDAVVSAESAEEQAETAEQAIEQNVPAVKAGEKAKSMAEQAGEAAKAMAEQLKEKGGPVAKQAGEKAKAAASMGWEKASEVSTEGWDRAGRIAVAIRKAVDRHPISPLFYAAILAVIIGVITFNGTYTRAYVLNVDGVEVGLLENQEELDTIVGNVETRVSGILGEDFSYDAKITLTPAYATPDSFSDVGEVEETLFDGVGALIDAALLTVDGVDLGYAPSANDFYTMLDEIAQPYLTPDAVKYDFVEDVEITPVQLPSNTQFDLDSIRATLTACEVEDAYYTVEKGDTFNAIAYSLDMWPNELSALNPDVEVNKLWVGQELLIQQSVPYLSVITITNETYEEVIESPVEYIETSKLYVGNTSVKELGSDGLALVNADVTYINGVEAEREVITSTTLEEATTTYMYTGTTPRPATASNGYYIWPVRGTITSYFGYRWGSTHLGLDIGCSYGTTIKAADGGTVTYAGWRGSYGNLVIITHDNGNQTYYAHNSSLLVSAGTKVYQGQAIARAGATGNATGPHCHFEIRINGTCVNPLNYL